MNIRTGLNAFVRLLIWPAVAITLAIFTACTRSPVVEYYVLSPAVEEYKPQAQYHGAGVLAVATPSVPSYLDRDEIVERLPDSAVRIHEHQRWASDLDTMIRDYLIAALQERVPGISFVSQDTKLARRANLRWEGVFTRLNIHHGEEIALALSWHLLDVNGQILRGQNEIRITQALDDESISSIVEVLNAVLAQIATEIALGIRDISSADGSGS